MCIPSNYWICPTLEGESFDGWIFYPDSDPCKVVYKFMLPEGLSYKEGSLKVRKMGCYDITGENYTLKISGNQVIVEIDDIKSEPFYIPFNKEGYDKSYGSYVKRDYEGIISSINVLFSTNFSGDATPVNTVSGSVTYSYKGNSKTIDFGSRNIYSASMKINHTDIDGNPLTGGTFTLYAQEAVFAEGSSLGTYQWKEIKRGLRSGDVVNGIGKNYYKLVQDTFPDGYKKYITPEFSVGIKANNGTPSVTATDNNSWTALDVTGGVVQVAVKNAKSNPPAQNGHQVVEAGNAAKDSATVAKTEADVSADSPVNASQSLDVVVTYYKDSVKESSMIYKTNESISTGMLDTKNISSRSYAFKGCILQKITLDGEEINAIPDSVKVGSTICFYYVTE